MGKLGYLLDLGQFFTHGLSSVSIPHIWGVWVMAYPYGIVPNPYVTSIVTSNLNQECMHNSFLRSQKMTSKSGYWSLLPCSTRVRGRANSFRTIQSSRDSLSMHFTGP